jgi:putative flippase GtrA
LLRVDLPGIKIRGEVIATTHNLRSSAKNFYVRHPQLVRSAGVSLFLMPLGFILLYMGVTVLGWAAWATNIAVGIFMQPLGFWAQRRFGFKSEETLAREGFTLWIAKAGATSGLSVCAFTLMVETWSMPYAAVRWGLNFTIGPVSYLVNKRWIFNGRNPLSRLIEPLVRSGVLLWIILRLWVQKKYREVQTA